MAATTTLLTIDDFERLPADIAENRELVDGELIDASGNNPDHNWLRDYLIVLLAPFITARGLGRVISGQEYDFEGNAHGPDVSFFGPAKMRMVDRRKRVQRFVPDLAVEIASPSDTYDGLMVKKDRYLHAGVLEVWLISLESREVAMYSSNAIHVVRGAEAITTGLLPGFSIAVDALFQSL